MPNLTFQMLPKLKPILESDQRFIRFQGGAGSGKSVAIAQYIILKAMSKERHRIFAFRKVGRTVKNSIFETFQDLISEQNILKYWKINRTDRSFTFLPNKNQIICGGMDDPEKVKSIKDPTIIWMEEATEFNYPDFEQLNLRLRKMGVLNQLILSYNPISTDNWIYNRFHLQKELNGRELFIQSTYRDNPFIPRDTRQALEHLADTNEKAYRVYNLGEWANLMDGVIFPDFEIIDEFPENLLAKSIFGLDFGFVDPMALVRVAIHENDVYADCSYYRTETTIETLVRSMHALPVRSADLVYCDSARPGDIQSLYNAGFKGAIGAIKGQGSILSGIEKLKSYRIHVTARSVELIGELNKYCYREDKDGNLLEKPIDDFNHAIDALRYAVYSHTYKPARGAKRVQAAKHSKIQKRRI